MRTLQRSSRLLFIIVTWGIFVFLNCHLLPPQKAPRVEVEIIQPARMRLLVRASGNLNPKDSNTVKADFDGPVFQKKFREGQTVKKGDILLVLGREKIQLDFQNKKDALDNAVSDLTKARREVRLQRALFQKQAVAHSAVEDADRAVIKAEQNLRGAQETFREMQKIWNGADVLSPLDGTVVKDWIGEDKLVSAGKEIVTIADVSEFTVHARVDELDIRSIHENQPAEVHLSVYDSAVLPAVVTEIGTTPEANGLLSLPVVLKILNTNGLLLRPKLTCEVTIFTADTEPILSVPSSAIANAEGENRLWVLDSLHRLRARKVELGRSTPKRVEILKGISAGTAVVTSAEPEFSDGMQVFIGKNPSSAVHSKTHAIIDKLNRESMKNRRRAATPPL